MNKKGFTLAEVVVTLGVVGILTAITAPTLVNLIPDKDKVQVLKAHKLITDANIELLNDPGSYFGDGSCVGFGCDDRPLRPPLSTITPGVEADEKIWDKYSDNMKYARMLCVKLIAESTCSNDATDSLTFTTPDGVSWTVDNDRDVHITINTNSDQKTFSFMVNMNGKVDGLERGTEKDALTVQYLKTRDKLNNKKIDKICATNPEHKVCVCTENPNNEACKEKKE